MAIDVETLILAGEGLQVVFPVEGYSIDRDLTHIALNAVIPISNLESLVLQKIDHLDGIIRKLPGHTNFSGMRNHLSVRPYKSETTNEREKNCVRAIIEDEAALMLLAKVGRYERGRKAFIGSCCYYFKNDPAAPTCLKQIDGNHPLNQIEAQPSMYIPKQHENESLIKEKSYFKEIGLNISICKYKSLGQEHEAYRITFADVKLFSQKIAELLKASMESKQAASPSSTPTVEQLTRTVAELLNRVTCLKNDNTKLQDDNTNLKKQVETLEAENAALKEKFAASSATDEIKKSALIHSDSPFAPPKAAAPITSIAPPPTQQPQPKQTL